MARRKHVSFQTICIFEELTCTVGWLHGYELMQRTGLKSGSLYPILMRLADDGLLELRWEDSKMPGRPPRKAYRLTAEGRTLARIRIGERASPGGSQGLASA